jgi:hypothetical protein
MLKPEDINKLGILIDNAVTDVAGLHGDTEKIENEVYEAITGLIAKFKADRVDQKSAIDTYTPRQTRLK